MGMSDDVQVALIGAIALVVVAMIPMLVQVTRMRSENRNQHDDAKTDRAESEARIIAAMDERMVPVKASADAALAASSATAALMTARIGIEDEREAARERRFMKVEEAIVRIDATLAPFAGGSPSGEGSSAST